MSFILEALRKSENERRLESTPQVMRMPAAVQHNVFPIWAAVVITALTVSLIAVTAVSWWNTRPLTSAPSSNGQSLIERRTVAPQVDAADSRALDIAATGAAPSGQAQAQRVPSIASPAKIAPEPALLQPPDASIAMPARTAGPPTAEVPARAPKATVDTESLPSMTALAAEGMTLPPLDLQLHVNSDIPANRFVMINGRRYKEGERLQEGLLLIQVAAAGAVLEIDGRQFLLVTN